MMRRGPRLTPGPLGLGSRGDETGRAALTTPSATITTGSLRDKEMFEKKRRVVAKSRQEQDGTRHRGRDRWPPRAHPGHARCSRSRLTLALDPAAAETTTSDDQGGLGRMGICALARFCVQLLPRLMPSCCQATMSGVAHGDYREAADERPTAAATADGAYSYRI